MTRYNTYIMQINPYSHIPVQTQIAQQEAEALLKYRIAHQIEVNKREAEEIERKCRLVQDLRVDSLPTWLL